VPKEIRFSGITPVETNGKGKCWSENGCFIKYLTIESNVCYTLDHFRQWPDLQ